MKNIIKRSVLLAGVLAATIIFALCFFTGNVSGDSISSEVGGMTVSGEAGILPNMEEFLKVRGSLFAEDYIFENTGYDVYIYPHSDEWYGKATEYIIECINAGFDYNVQIIDKEIAFILSCRAGKAMLMLDHEDMVMLMVESGLEMEDVTLSGSTNDSDHNIEPETTEETSVQPTTDFLSTEKKKCHLCNGKGYDTCQTCNGKGVIEVHVSSAGYNGIGSGSSETVTKPCSNIFCENGRVECWWCNGTGWEP